MPSELSLPIFLSSNQSPRRFRPPSSRSYPILSSLPTSPPNKPPALACPTSPSSICKMNTTPLRDEFKKSESVSVMVVV
ncbi:hypothetical protein JAAARDRAFT_27669 [Jaapia argillacea MUCL 33604]|uniref:Uncharacterized protein n=1 Tax=Jaapia argillacea MUCL 33604 TaxID=933084 RepID=A0A067QN37_9AGAM|nr:hypothetical protein JAAARDRAFT_27669 [Jaapia argillacea MUCL 33604]